MSEPCAWCEGRATGCKHCNGTGRARPPNPRAEICNKCGCWIYVLGQYCEWDGGTCNPRGRK